MNKVVPIRPAPKSVRSTMQTMIFDLSEIESWRHPPFQRPIKVNNKVRELAEELKGNGGIITGVITLGKIGSDPATWIVDGQHRCESFKISGLKEIIADVRICHFDTMAEMATEFVRLQQQLVRMRPDDILRGMEASIPALRRIREQCPFVGYDFVRRNATTAAILSMSVMLRCWFGSIPETPALAHGGSAAMMAENLTDDKDLIIFLLTAHAAWGRDEEFFRLWGSLNLTLCAWLYRRLVIDRDRSGNRRAVECHAEWTPGEVSLTWFDPDTQEIKSAFRLEVESIPPRDIQRAIDEAIAA